MDAFVILKIALGICINKWNSHIRAKQYIFYLEKEEEIFMKLKQLNTEQKKNCVRTWKSNNHVLTHQTSSFQYKLGC